MWQCYAYYNDIMTVDNYYWPSPGISILNYSVVIELSSVYDQSIYELLHITLGCSFSIIMFSSYLGLTTWQLQMELLSCTLQKLIGNRVCKGKRRLHSQSGKTLDLVNASAAAAFHFSLDCLIKSFSNLMWVCAFWVVFTQMHVW